MRMKLALWQVGAVLAVVAASAGPLAAQGGDPQLKASAVASVDKARPGDTFQVAVILEVPKGFHVNSHAPADKSLVGTDVKLTPAKGTTVGAVSYPKGFSKVLALSPQAVSLYEGKVIFRVPVTVAKSTKPGKLVWSGTVNTQPCNDQTCFRPRSVSFSLPLVIAPAGTKVKSVHPELFPKPAPKKKRASLDLSFGLVAAADASPLPPPRAGGPGGGSPGAGAEASRADLPALRSYTPPEQFLKWLKDSQAEGAATESKLGALLLGGNLLLALPLIFLAGLALNLTPCVYPLIPITVGFFSRQGGGSKGRVVTLAGFYVLGMAVMYSTLGVAAALSHKLFGSQLQNPYVLIAFAVVMLALGLSMFDVWEMRLPSGLQNHASARAGYVGALIMGLLVGVVAAPCVGPAVVALLQVVGEIGSPTLGFGVFFTLALGLGVPYLVLGSFSGLLQKMPRSGEWMNAVKHVFGLIMFGMALYYLKTLMSDTAFKAVVMLYGLGAGVYLLFLDGTGSSARRFFAMKRSLGAVAAVAAVWFVLPHGSAPKEAGLHFEPYSEQRITEARAAGRPVLVDFGAEWCLACKEMEAKTFADPRVVKALQGVVTLRADMTNNTPEVDRLYKEYGIVGLPHVALIPAGK